MKTLLMLAASTMLALAGHPALAQEYAAVSADERGADPAFATAELDQMLAPIALYPDELLSQVLMASTYPLEVVEAARWSRDNPDLEGEQAVEAVADFDWDPSVKGLVAFPDVLRQMDEDLDWMRRLGDAFLYQQDDLMERVQFLRERAYRAGNLESGEYARVVREDETIAIEPVYERVVHVPYYDSRRAYGSWLHPAYPPYYWLPPPFYLVGHDGFFWSHGIGLSPGFFYSSLYWPQRHLIIRHAPRHCHRHHHRPHREFTAGERWRHDPRHRRGVDYRHADLRDRARNSGPRPRSTLARGIEPASIAPDRRTARPDTRARAAPVSRRGGSARRGSSSAPPARPAPPRVVSDSGSRESRASSPARRRAIAADDRSQGDSGSRSRRTPAAALVRPR